MEIYLKSHVYQQPKGVKIIINFVYNSEADLGQEKKHCKPPQPTLFSAKIN